MRNAHTENAAGGSLVVLEVLMVFVGNSGGVLDGSGSKRVAVGSEELEGGHDEVEGLGNGSEGKTPSAGTESLGHTKMIRVSETKRSNEGRQRRNAYPLRVIVPSG